MSAHPEKIMVVLASIFDGLPRNTLITNKDANLARTKIINNFEYKVRDEVEHDKTFRQPIPYTLLEYREGEEQKFLLLQRVSGEERLAGKHYIGVGGHIEDSHTIALTVLKEIHEETGCDIRSLTFSGIILMDTCPVEEVHVGVFYHAYVKTMELQTEENHNHRWVDADELIEKYENMEGWSQLIVNDYLNIK